MSKKLLVIFGLVFLQCTHLFTAEGPPEPPRKRRRTESRIPLLFQGYQPRRLVDEFNLADWKDKVSEAIKNDDIDTLTTLFATEQQKQQVNMELSSKNRFLLAAIRGKKHRAIDFFLSLKTIDVNAQNSRGETPLILALQNRDKRVSSILLSHQNIDLSKVDIDEWTHLMFAVAHNMKDVFKKILKRHSSNATKRNNQEDTALQIAIDHGHIYFVEQLACFHSKKHIEDFIFLLEHQGDLSGNQKIILEYLRSMDKENEYPPGFEFEV